MKKITHSIFKNAVFFMLVFFANLNLANAQCIRANEYLVIASTNSGTLQNIGTCSYSNAEYNTLTGLIVGGSYQFISRNGSTYGAGAQNFVTITDASNNVIGSGVSPLTVTVTSANVRLHHASNAACGGAADCNNSQFQFLPNCGIPTGLSTTSLTTTSATVSWSAVTSATSGYEYVNSTVNTAPAGAGTPTTSTTATFTGLTPSTNYYFWVRSNCGGGSFGNWSLLSYYTGYCQPSSTSALTYINDFSTTGGTTNINNAASGYTTGGFQDNFASSNLTSFAGGSVNYSFTLVGGTAGVAIWVDTNNNLIFETSERVYDSASYLSDGTYTGAIAVPATLAVGEYRVRIRTDWNATSPDPCAVSFNRTEAEDYKLTITAAPVDAMDFNNIQWVTNGTNGSNTTLTVPAGTALTAYAEGYEANVTEPAGAGTGVEAWIGFSSTNTNPNTWPASAWVAATYVDNQGNNDNFSRALTLPVGTNYVASRWRLNNASFTYGGYNGSWNGTTNNSIQVTVLPIVNDECTGATPFTYNDALCNGTNNNGTNVNATASATPNPTCFNYGQNDVWYSFVVPAGVATVDVSTDFAGGTLVDTEIALYGGTCGALNFIACDQDSGTTVLSNGSSYNSIITNAAVTAGQTYYVRVSGYSATATGTFCLKASTNTLSNETFDSASFKFYPNPVKDVLNLSYSSVISKVQVVNLLGQEVLSKNLNSTESQLDMSTLSSGTYLVKVTSEGLVKTIKVIKE